MIFKKQPIALLIISAAILSACSHSHNHRQDEHNHDGVSLLLTSYSDRLEMFADVHPLAVGHESDIALHISSLPDFRPVEKASADVTLTVAGKSTSLKIDSLSHHGIFHMHLTPETAGDGTLTFVVNTPLGADTLSAPVTVYTDEHQALHHADEMMPHSSNAIKFTKEMSWKIDFSTTPAVMRPIGEVIHATARVESSPSDAVDITARAAGTVRFAAQLTQGMPVKAGQTLFTVDASALADNNLSVRIAEAKSAYDFAKAEFDRNTELAKDRLVTASQLAAAKAAYESAKANYDNLRSNFSAGRQSASAPIAGYITQLNVTNGQHVEAGQTLAQVSRNRDLYLTAEINPRHYSSLAGISDVTLRTAADGKTYTLSELGGSVAGYGRSVNPESSLIPVTFRLPNTIDLLPGSFVEIFISTASNDAQPALVVPASAIIEEMGRYFIFVQLTPELFEKTPVTLGKTDGRFTQITSGLPSGSRVVDKGAVIVKLAQGSQALDPHAGHVH